MILGFGTGEFETARKIINECQDAIKKNPEHIKDAVGTIKKKYAKAGKRYQKLGRDKAPERYTYFWFFYSEIYEGKYMVEFAMHHINRRHSLSTDGWALWKTNWILSVCPTDGTRVYRET